MYTCNIHIIHTILLYLGYCRTVLIYKIGIGVHRTSLTSLLCDDCDARLVNLEVSSGAADRVDCCHRCIDNPQFGVLLRATLGF